MLPGLLHRRVAFTGTEYDQYSVQVEDRLGAWGTSKSTSCNDGPRDNPWDEKDEDEVAIRTVQNHLPLMGKREVRCLFERLVGARFVSYTTNSRDELEDGEERGDCEGTLAFTAITQADQREGTDRLYNRYGGISRAYTAIDDTRTTRLMEPKHEKRILGSYYTLIRAWNSQISDVAGGHHLSSCQRETQERAAKDKALRMRRGVR